MTVREHDILLRSLLGRASTTDAPPGAPGARLPPGADSGARPPPPSAQPQVRRTVSPMSARVAVTSRRPPRGVSPLGSFVFATAIVVLLVWPVALALWAIGAYYTIVGITTALGWLTTIVGTPFGVSLVASWQSLGDARWAIPIAMSLAEFYWSPFWSRIRRTPGEYATSIVTAIPDALTTWWGLAGVILGDGWRGLATIVLTLGPELAMLFGWRRVRDAFTAWRATM